MTKLISTFIDYSNEESSAGLYVDAAITNADALSLNTAIAGLSLGTNKKTVLQLTNNIFSGSTAPPANKFAQRELRFLCKYTDNVTKKGYSFSIPCADANLVVGNTDMVDITTGAGATLKTRFEASAKSELGNAVTLNSVELIGRNN